MADREKLIRYYKGTEGEAAAVKLVDMAETVTKNRKYRLSGFLDPYGCEIAETIAANYPGINVSFEGGYPGAERQRAVFVHDDFMGKTAFDISVVKLSWSEDHYRLSHRDVLGAVLGLGIDRMQIGDLLIKAGSALVLTDQKMAAFLLENCLQIGAAKVSAEMAELEEIEPKEERCKEIKATVASLRADSVAAAGFGCSRSKAAADIEADKLKLNWQSVKNASQTVKEGDILSLRGRGRVEVVEVRGQTKKGRIGISLKRYI